VGGDILSDVSKADSGQVSQANDVRFLLVWEDDEANRLKALCQTSFIHGLEAQKYVGMSSDLST
jgi:hypothetical protein